MEKQLEQVAADIKFAVDKNIESMNVYKKLQHVRVEMNRREIKKTGWNGHAKYHYYLIEDFLPTAQSLMLEYGLMVHESKLKGKDIATVVNMDKPDETIVFQIRTDVEGVRAIANGQQEVQKLGSALTYIKRYLWINILQLTEGDAVEGADENGKKSDGVTKPKNTSKPKTPSKPKKEQPSKREVAMDMAQSLINKKVYPDMKAVAVEFGLNPNTTDEQFDIAIQEMAKRL